MGRVVARVGGGQPPWLISYTFWRPGQGNPRNLDSSFSGWQGGPLQPALKMQTQTQEPMLPHFPPTLSHCGLSPLPRPGSRPGT